jgi:hypothetical protein
MQFFHTNRFSGAADFAAYVIDAFDWLHREGAHAPKMMSIRLHLRMIDGPAASAPSTGSFGISPTEATLDRAAGRHRQPLARAISLRRLDMSASLIRSRAMVTHAIDRHRWNEVTDGALLQEDGTIVEIGTYRELSRKHPNVPVVGSGNEVLLPGFVNGHHHIGLTPVQLGSPDMPLSCGSSRACHAGDPTRHAHSAFEMIASV